ncbi:MAG: rod shape-determining protein MreC [Clostridia bacterium]|nr:rod shape-determining protein MreC [Clostridia bacterium]
MKHFFKTIGFKILGGIALVLIGVMIYAASTGGISTFFASAAGVVVTPLQTAVTSVSNAVSDFFGGIGKGGALRQQIAQLEEENRNLREQIVDYDEMKIENEWYSQILSLHEDHPDYTFADGKVITMDPSDPFCNFSINAGSAVGVSVGDPVVTADGLVGIVQEVGLTYSKVRTVLDPALKASASISRTDESGYTGGSLSLASEGLLRINYLERTSSVVSGDFVVTSGLGGVFPSGLLIGRVTAVTPDTDGMTLYGLVEPFVDIPNLKRVMVITSFDGQGE